MPGDHRRARLPRAVHAGPADVHGAAEAACAVAADRLRERRPLAELVRNGALLHRAPGVVPEVPRRRRRAVVDGGVSAQRGVRYGERKADRGEEGSAGEHAGEAGGEAEELEAVRHGRNTSSDICPRTSVRSDTLEITQPAENKRGLPWHPGCPS